MRCEELFDDLEAQLEAGSRRDLDAEVADRTRRERATVRLHQRLAGAVGTVLDIRTLGDAVVHGDLVDVGVDWLLVHESAGDAGGVQIPTLVPLAAVLTVGVGGPGQGPRSRIEGPPGSGVVRRFGFGYALRALSRDRATVAVTDITGLTYTGTIDAVGADALDLAEHPSDLPPRRENVSARRIVLYAAIAVIRHV